MDRWARAGGGRAISGIGQEISELLGFQPNRTFLYVEVDDEGYEISIFVEDDRSVLYHFPSRKIFELVQHLWEIADDEKKWSVLEFEVSDGNFDASFTFYDQYDPNQNDDDDEEDRCDQAIRKRFGGKPVIYPDLGPGAVKLTLDDLSHRDEEN